jgi:hypothetical protein
MAQQVCVVLSAADREQLATIAATAIGRASTSSGRASCSPRRIGSQRSGWRKPSASASRPCGGGNNASPRTGSRVCSATRPASRQNTDCRGSHGADGGADLHQTATPGDPLGRPGDGQGNRYLAGVGTAHLARTNCSRAGSAPSNARAIPALPPSSPTLSGSTSIRRPMRSCCRLTKRARSRPSTTPNPDCRSNPDRCQTMTHDY